MIGAIAKFLLYRVLGARIMLALGLLGFVRKLLGGRKRNQTPPTATGRSSVYQPSQGTSQIEHRDPR